MKKLILAAIVAMAVSGLFPARAADAVQPASCTITNFRSETESYISGQYYFEGTTLLLTNCVMYSGTSTSSTPQGLSGVTIAVDVGTTTTNLSYAGTAISTNLGTWWASVTVPSNLPTVYVQVKITDESTNTFIYPWKYMRTKASL